MSRKSRTPMIYEVAVFSAIDGSDLSTTFLKS